MNLPTKNNNVCGVIDSILGDLEFISELICVYFV